MHSDGQGTLFYVRILKESLDGLWNNRSYGGASELPRKDYQPYSASSGYSYPYQQGGNTMFPPTSPDPQNTPSVPWQMSNITDDLADGFVYILSALKKMERCLNENPALKPNQRKVLNKYIKYTKAALYIVKKIGKSIINSVNLAKALPPQSPTNS